MKWLKFSLLAVFLSGFTSCAKSNNRVGSKAFATLLDTMLSHSVTEIDVKEAVALPDDVIFLDARAKEEFAVSHIKGAIWADGNELQTLDKNKTIIVYCSIGVRSEHLTKKLKDAGFTDVRNLYGGIFEWVNQGHPVYHEGEETQKVHAYNKTWGIWLEKGEKVYK